MINPYKIETIYLPKRFVEYPHEKNSAYDYALVKLKTSVGSDDFIPLKGNYVQNKKVIGIFGYPGINYKNIDKISNTEANSQWGLMK